MSDTIFKIKQISSLVIFIVILSLMGMVTGKPIMMLAYAAFFLAVSVVVYFTLRKRQRHSEVVAGISDTTRKIIAGVLMLIAIVMPLMVAMRSNVINLPADMAIGMVVGSMLGFTLLFIALVLATIFFINRKGDNITNRIIGYLTFVIASALPGLLMSRVDSTTMGIGSVYYVAMAVLILAYNAVGLFCNQE